MNVFIIVAQMLGRPVYYEQRSSFDGWSVKEEDNIVPLPQQKARNRQKTPVSSAMGFRLLFHHHNLLLRFCEERGASYI
jgi:hypothetical protein